ALADSLGLFRAERERVDHVRDVAPGAILRAVAVDRQVAPRECRLDERPDCAPADLAGPEDVERADGDDRDAVLLAVGMRHVLARELRYGASLARLPDR